MNSLDFGRQLRLFRLQTNDPTTKRPLTQQKLGELLGIEIGRRSAYTGAAVSDWERGESRIDADDRLLLVRLVKILNQYRGIKTPGGANLLLESGNFRALNMQEREMIFPDETDEDDPPAPVQNSLNTQFLFENLNFISPVEYAAILEKAKQGPSPYLPRMIVALTKRFTDGISTVRVLRGILWIWIWLITYYLISPSLNWYLLDSTNTFLYMVLYATGACIIPLFIAVMTNTKNNAFWMEHEMHNSIMLRLYVYQGAYVGFHVGYFLIIPISLLQVQLGLGTSAVLEVVKVFIPLWIGYASSHLIPFNLWLAYHRLNIKDGGIFFVFTLVPFFWAWFFLEFHDTFFSPFVGIIVFLTSLTIAVMAQMMKIGKKKPS
ncbi:MAG: helix-turn-helix transcriptional regulator [Chloroflexi bacterium]|nr:helix-turn-helix transcriptional regulator [Chloroflexota bacterium]